MIQGSQGQSVGTVVLTLDSQMQTHLQLPAVTGGRVISLSRYGIAGSYVPPDPRVPLESGWYWVANQGGSGTAIELQGANLLLADFSPNNGAATWNMVSGLVANDVLHAGAQTAAGGPSLTNNHEGPISFMNAGSATLDQLSDRQARLTIGGNAAYLSRFTLF